MTCCPGNGWSASSPLSPLERRNRHIEDFLRRRSDAYDALEAFDDVGSNLLARVENSRSKIAFEDAAIIDTLLAAAIEYTFIAILRNVRFYYCNGMVDYSSDFRAQLLIPTIF